ncbi:hypothetical protein TELCIR_16964 [Teladorsagia circumcincta]|uniref:ZP domain-containing protein n=1 Tax=Teladorsagia circumcincta TaxID=45464 RepID=A0A2G9TU24_TELCI|nr:hypothetical protein TELCIR_16964 [Teladorsagia circumcincta]
MNYVLTFVTNFHPHFMTKVDRAYNVRCFYAYIDKTVNADMEVRCPEALPVQLRPIVYDPSLSSAYMVVEAFVFPDRSNVQFQCQVQICDRRDNECLGVTVA